MIEEDEDRVDGRELRALSEPGSDDLLSDEVKARISEAIVDIEVGQDDDRAGERGSRRR